VPRKDGGKKIGFRVTEDEWSGLVLEAGDFGISAHVRARLFSGGVRNRDGLRRIAALHLIGRRLQRLTEYADIDAYAVAAALTDVRTAIARFAHDISGADATDDPA
jgi:hypothetical protein